MRVSVSAPLQSVVSGAEVWALDAGHYHRQQAPGSVGVWRRCSLLGPAAQPAIFTFVA